MPLIPFPNVPKVPGVPMIPRSPNFPALGKASLGVLQGALWRAFQLHTLWGIYDSKGNPLADPRRFTGVAGDLLNTLGGTSMSTNSVDYSKEMKVSDFPIEKGSFASYNKVEQPATPSVSLAFSGNEADRKKFLDAIDKACKSTDLYDVVTPEVRYVGYSIDRYNYQRRQNKGAYLLIVEIMLKEVRQVSVQYTQSNKAGLNNTKTPSSTPQVDGGKVQAKTPDVSTLKSLANQFPNLASKVQSLISF